ncbi:MAG: hypothetical protein Q4B32_09490 [Clostridia bacterium]|nr:hypothetical protein [Clostridia bacterium]
MKLNVNNAGKKFGKTWIFRDASMTFEPGKIYGFAGKNGSGKTMLMLFDIETGDGTMKPLKAFLFASLLLLPLVAHGETQYYSISDLPSVPSARWKETYQAYGRTIDVDVEIEIPDVDTAPVLLVRNVMPINEKIAQGIERQCEIATGKDKINSY